MVLLKRIRWILPAVLLLTSCGIYSFKGSIPDHLHDLELVTFKNLTTEFAVETDIEEALTERMLNEQLLPLTAKETPDSRIEGKINSITDKPNSFDENENILEYRLEFRAFAASIEPQSNLMQAQRKREESPQAHYLRSRTTLRKVLEILLILLVIVYPYISYDFM